MTNLVQQSTTQLALKFFLTASSDHITGLTGATPTVTIRKEGGSFASPAGSVTEIASGWYQVAANATDTNTLGNILLHATAASADPCDMIAAQVVAFNPQGVIPTVGTGANQINVDGAGNVFTSSNIKKNVALNGFTFPMTDATTHAPKTGLTVTAQRSLNGAAFASCANAVSELSNGNYTINLAAADMNANTVLLRFTSSGADDLDILVVTTP